MKTVTIYTDGVICYADHENAISLAADAATAKYGGKRRRGSFA